MREVKTVGDPIASAPSCSSHLLGEAHDDLIVIDDDRVVEIARMLGGDADRAVSRAHARELIDRGAGDQRRGNPV